MAQKSNSLPFWNILWNALWNIWCVVSIIGIWPRFIEPYLVSKTRLKIALADLPVQINGLKIVFFSDLHISSRTSRRFLEKAARKIQEEKPDLILIGGDFLTQSKLDGMEVLEYFLNKLSAPHGIFACLGNHDYAIYTTLDNSGSSVAQTADEAPSIASGFRRLFGMKAELPQPAITGPIPTIPELASLLKKCGVALLHNEIRLIEENGVALQIAGLGDMLSHNLDPHAAFSQYDPRVPCIVLSHNPDSWSILKAYPGDLYLFGHTHGGQVNLPWIWKKLTPMLDYRLKRGLFYEHTPGSLSPEKTLYVSRGLGSTFPFRWFATPEIVAITLAKKGPGKERSFALTPALSQFISPKPSYTQMAHQESPLTPPSQIVHRK